MANSIPLSSMINLLLLLAALPHLILSDSGVCLPSGQLPGKFGHCKAKDGPNCCANGKIYPLYRCSPPIAAATHATMTLRSFTRPPFGGRQPGECDNKYHAHSERVVALSTGWYNGGQLCGKNIRVSANRMSVVAKVVDECVSSYGCDHVYGFQQPCGNNVVAASPAVWRALGIKVGRGRGYEITWSDAS